MRISIILAHPDEGSFNHAIAQTAKETLLNNGHEVFYHDLHKENFVPLLPASEIPRDVSLPQEIDQHCDELTQADGIIIVHPNWWGMPPAVLKGWVDRVIRPGIAYEFVEGDSGEGVPVGLLKAEKAMVFNTSNTVGEREEKVFGDPLQRIWKDCIFDLCGVQNFYRRMFRVIVTSTDDERKKWLKDVAESVSTHFPAR